MLRQGRTNIPTWTGRPPSDLSISEASRAALPKMKKLQWSQVNGRGEDPSHQTTLNATCLTSIRYGHHLPHLFFVSLCIRTYLISRRGSTEPEVNYMLWFLILHVSVQDNIAITAVELSVPEGTLQCLGWVVWCQASDCVNLLKTTEQ